MPSTLRSLSRVVELPPAARGAIVRLYSGTSGDLSSPTRNRVPVTAVDVRLQPGAHVDQTLPNYHNGFLYVLEGEARVGAERARLRLSQVATLVAKALAHQVPAFILVNNKAEGCAPESLAELARLVRAFLV